MKTIWSGIKQLVTLKGKSSGHPSKIILNNQTIKDPKAIATAFNNYFARIGSKLADDIPLVDIEPESYLGPQLLNSFCLFPVTSSEIADEISNLNVSKAIGPFSISACLLKLLKSCISKPLKIIDNFSFSSGSVPDHFKLANVIPIHKNDSVTSMNNYRPISLLSIFNKILEKLMYKRLISFIQRHNLFYEKQFGFREHHSTMDAALLITVKIQRAIEEGQYSCGIFLDFSKAFDTVDHKILLKKLYHYGVCGTTYRWFDSYLSNRKQFVSIGNEKSEILLIALGVPQGSVLGPLLFILYINNFYKSSDIFDFHIFANDTNLFSSHKSLLALESEINSNLYHISNWLAANEPSLNTEKTNFIIIHPHWKKTNYPIKMYINDRSIKREMCIEYLGIFIDT